MNPTDAARYALRQGLDTFHLASGPPEKKMPKAWYCSASGSVNGRPVSYAAYGDTPEEAMREVVAALEAARTS